MKRRTALPQQGVQPTRPVHTAWAQGQEQPDTDAAKEAALRREVPPCREAAPSEKADASKGIAAHKEAGTQGITAASTAGAAPWHVYLLECADGTLYCGITTNIARRVAQHNGEERGGAKYTRTRCPVVLCAHAPCADKSSALKLEYRVRTLAKKDKIPFLRRLHA